MSNYKIEGDFDFYAELMKELDVDEKNEDSNSKTCLITGEPLDEMHITLKCKHTFNYIPILNEIAQQKKRNNLETTYLGSREIKCPYCRNVQNGLLPKWSLTCHEVKRQYGVNSPAKFVYKPFNCCYEFTSGKKKGTICNEPSSAKYCDKHVKKYYSDKKKESDKKQESEQNKESEKTNNVITQNNGGCTEILRYGKRKGQQCGCKIFNNSVLLLNGGQQVTLCKRHYNIANSK